MTPYCKAAVVAIVVASGAVVGSSQPRTPTPAALQQPTFRGGADAVTVDVVVKDGGRVVGGLTTSDFGLRDNGVSQTIDRVVATAVPVDVTLIVDVSGGLSGMPVTPLPSGDVNAEVNKSRATIAAMLRPDDRLRVLAIDGYLQPLSDMQPASASTSASVTAYGGRPSVHDAIAAALMRAVELERRHFVFAFTKGVDGLGSSNARTLTDIAARSDATLYVVEQDAALLAEDQAQDCFCFMAEICAPTVRFASPIQRRIPRVVSCDPDRAAAAKLDPQPRLGRNRAMLREAAARTGGAVYDAGFFSTRDIVDAFREIFDDFRRGTRRGTPHAASGEKGGTRLPSPCRRIPTTRFGHAQATRWTYRNHRGPRMPQERRRVL